MSLMFNIIGSNLADDTVRIPTTAFDTFGDFTGPAYSGVKFDTDGNCYARQAQGGWSSIGAWLKKGTASNYYIQRVIDDGTLDTDSGDGVQMNADRTYDIIQTAPFREKTAVVTFEISTDAPGTTVKAGPTAHAYSATWETRQ